MNQKHQDEIKEICFALRRADIPIDLIQTLLARCLWCERVGATHFGGAHVMLWWLADRILCRGWPTLRALSYVSGRVSEAR